MHLDPLAIITAFGLIFLAELPDKTMFASLAMGTRMRPLYVWFGTSSAFIVHVAIAVGAGSLHRAAARLDRQAGLGLALRLRRVHPAARQGGDDEDDAG